MRRFTGWIGLSVLAIGVLAGVSASAAPVTYYLTQGQITTIQLQDIQAPITPTSCPIGSGNCLVNAPLALSGASITVDLATNQLLDLSVFISGPGIIDMNGLNGYEAIVFNNTSFQSSGATTLTPSGPQFNFAMPGVVSASTVELWLLGNPGPFPGPTPDFSLPYVNPTTPGGNIQFANGQAILTLTGVDLGVFVDPLTGGNRVLAKADFAFSAAIPEPSAVALYGVGLLIVAGAATRRWAARVS